MLWRQLEKIKEINIKKASLEREISHWKNLHKALEDLPILLELSIEQPKEYSELKSAYHLTLNQLKHLEVCSLLAGVQDKNNGYVSINAGAGGVEATDWVQMLQRMYFKWAFQKAYQVEILHLSEGEEGGGGIRSCSFLVKGEFVFGHLKAEIGVHRLVRISPFDANKRRHTSFAGVFVWPELLTENSNNIEIKDAELRVDTYRAGGAGGQHVNKTNSAVRITHLPTGIVVQCQNQRSQHANRNQALKMLKSALHNRKEEEKKREKQSVESSKAANEWGNQIRSYILHPYQMVKDHRTGLESPNPQAILNGNINEFISAWLKKMA